MRDVDLAAEDRVVLLLPGSKEYVELVIRLLAAEIVPVPLDPRLTRRERHLILTDLDPAIVVHEERELWDFRSTDVHLVLSPLHHSAPLRFAIGTLLAGPTTMFCVPTHLQRLFAHWDLVGVPDLSSFPAGRACRRPLPTARQRTADRAFPAAIDLGILRLHRRAVHRLPQRGLAASSGHRRPRTAGQGTEARQRRHHLVRGPRARAFHLLEGAGEDRGRVAGDIHRSGVHRRGSGKAGPRRLPIPTGGVRTE